MHADRSALPVVERRRAREEVDRKPGFKAEALPCMDAVYRFALRMCRGDQADASDAVQETYLRAYRSWSTYTQGTNVVSWLFTICRNVVLRHAERRSTQQEVAVSDLGLDDVEPLAVSAQLAGTGARDAENAFFDGIIDEEVLRAVDSLPPEFREPIVLKDIQDLPYGEIAEILGIPRGTVKSRLHRGRRILMERLHDYAVEAGYIPGDREAIKLSGPTEVGRQDDLTAQPVRVPFRTEAARH